MAKIHVRSYLDAGAPQFDGLDRRAFIKFFKEHFEKTPYIQQFSTSLIVDPNSKTIQLVFSSTPLFSIGQLIAITSTDNTVFQSTQYRIVDIQNNVLILKIDNYDQQVYPLSDTNLGIKAQLAPLNWEICWSDTNKFSMRSKNPASSKNVFTIHSHSFSPAMAEAGSGVTNIKYATASVVRVSRDINKTTGALIEDLTQTTHNLYTADPLIKETLFFNWNCYSYSYSNAYNGNIPWFLIANDKFFYILVGSYGSTSSINNADRNYTRQQSYGVSRNTYMFGDPDFLGDPNLVDRDGTILQASYNVNWDTSTTFHQSKFTERLNSAYGVSSKSSGNTYFMRDYYTTLGSSSSNDIVTSTSLTISNFQSTSGGNNSFGYPNKITGGILTFPIYLSKTIDSGSTSNGSYVRSILPFVVTCHTNLTNLAASNWTLLDYNAIKLYDGRMLMPIVTSCSSTIITSLALFELD